MISDVLAAWFSAALSAFQVIGGIQGSALWTGIVLLHFPEPLFITNMPDSFKISPDFYPVGHCRLKLLQVIAGIFFAFTAKVNSSLCRTGG